MSSWTLTLNNEFVSRLIISSFWRYYNIIQNQTTRVERGANWFFYNIESGSAAMKTDFSTSSSHVCEGHKRGTSTDWREGLGEQDKRGASTDWWYGLGEQDKKVASTGWIDGLGERTQAHRYKANMLADEKSLFLSSYSMFAVLTVVLPVMLSSCK